MASLSIVLSSPLLLFLLVLVPQHVNSKSNSDVEEVLGIDATEMHMRMDAFFALIDTNGDNVITNEEMHIWLGKVKQSSQKKEAIAEFESVDRDSDGQVSFDEMREAYGASEGSDEAVAVLKKRFDAFDVDKSGLLSKDEFTIPSNNPEILENSVDLMLETDRDKDGKISIREFLSDDDTTGAEELAEYQSEFDAYDLNGDGFIDRDEIRKAVADPFEMEISDSELQLREIVAELNGVNETETFTLTKEIWTLHAPRFALSAATYSGEMLRYPVDYELDVEFKNLPPLDKKKK